PSRPTQTRPPPRASTSQSALRSAGCRCGFSSREPDCDPSLPEPGCLPWAAGPDGDPSMVDMDFLRTGRGQHTLEPVHLVGAATDQQAELVAAETRIVVGEGLDPEHAGVDQQPDQDRKSV